MSNAAPSALPREVIRLAQSGQPTLNLQLQRPASPIVGASDVVYVHGATFGADLSIFYRFDGRSWADAINDIGMNVWGFDFAGYGSSDRYRQDGQSPAGRMVDVIPQLQRVIAAVRARAGGRPVTLVSHSWGAAVAARYTQCYPHDVSALVLFGPFVTRAGTGSGRSAQLQPSHYPLTQWAQYRRFTEDVPRGHPQVLSEAHFQTWGADFLSTDPGAAERMPPSVVTPFGPLLDIDQMWSGQSLYDATQIVAPTLLVRGEWDSVCNDEDAKRLMEQLSSSDKRDLRIERATHLMHLESQRIVLHDQVNAFLTRSLVGGNVDRCVSAGRDLSTSS